MVVSHIVEGLAWLGCSLPLSTHTFVLRPFWCPIIMNGVEPFCMATAEVLESPLVDQPRAGRLQGWLQRRRAYRPRDCPDTADDSGVVQASPVTVQLHKLVSYIEDDIQARGPVWVARHLQALHRREPAVGLLPELRADEGRLVAA